MARDLHRTIDTVWRMESARIIGAIARRVRDVGLAEELAQDALVAALEHWPKDGIPDNPGAWLMATAKNRALDRLRQLNLHHAKQQELGADADARGDHVVPDFVDSLDDADDIGDDLLRLVFTACHPVLSREAQVALTLKLLAGMSTAEIARAFLQPEPTIAQRIVRAKRTLVSANVPFEVPRGEALQDRLAAVLEVVYLIFNEGYSATAGDDWTRPALCEEALRLARILAQLSPGTAEVLGLVALMEIQASRMHARLDAEGKPILLMAQDRGRWDQPRPGCARARRAARRRAGAVPAAGGDRGLPRARPHARGHRLGPHRRAVRRADDLPAIAGGGAQSRGRGEHGLGAGGRAAARRRPRHRRPPGALPPAARGARRPAGAAGSPRRGAHGVRARRRDDGQRAREGAAVRACA